MLAPSTGLATRPSVARLRFQTGLQWSAMPANVTPTAMTAHPAPIMTATSDPAPVIAATAVPAPIIAAPIIAAPIVAAPVIAGPIIAISAEGEHAGVPIRIVLNTLNRQTDRIGDMIDFRNSGNSAGRHGRRGNAKEAKSSNR